MPRPHPGTPAHHPEEDGMTVLPRVSLPWLDHLGVYITWGADPKPYCRGVYLGEHIMVMVSPDLELDPTARRYVEEDIMRRFRGRADEPTP